MFASNKKKSTSKHAPGSTNQTKHTPGPWKEESFSTSSWHLVGLALLLVVLLNKDDSVLRISSVIVANVLGEFQGHVDNIHNLLRCEDKMMGGQR